MDDFAVDLDKLLDDLEQREEPISSNSQFNNQTLLQKNQQSAQENDISSLESKNASLVHTSLYGQTDHGDVLDLSNADFAPAAPRSTEVIAAELQADKHKEFQEKTVNEIKDTLSLSSSQNSSGTSNMNSPLHQLDVGPRSGNNDQIVPQTASLEDPMQEDSQSHPKKLNDFMSSPTNYAELQNTQDTLIRSVVPEESSQENIESSSVDECDGPAPKFSANDNLMNYGLESYNNTIDVVQPDTHISTSDFQKTDLEAPQSPKGAISVEFVDESAEEIKVEISFEEQNMENPKPVGFDAEVSDDDIDNFLSDGNDTELEKQESHTPQSEATEMDNSKFEENLELEPNEILKEQNSEVILEHPANQLHTQFQPGIAHGGLTFNDVGPRGNEKSVEKFLVPDFPSPNITTPIDDAGFSRVPGFLLGCNMPALEEESEIIKEENHSPSTDQKSSIQNNDSIVNTISDICEKETENNEVHQPAIDGLAVNHVSTEVQKRDISSRSGIGTGARPKDSMHSKKARPNSLLGLSTPDIAPLPTRPPHSISMDTGLNFCVNSNTNTGTTPMMQGLTLANSLTASEHMKEDTNMLLNFQTKQRNHDNMLETRRSDDHVENMPKPDFSLSLPLPPGDFPENPVHDPRQMFNENQMPSAYSVQNPEFAPVQPPSGISPTVPSVQFPSNLDMERGMDTQDTDHSVSLVSGKQKRPTSLNLTPREEYQPQTKRSPSRELALQLEQDEEEARRLAQLEAQAQFENISDTSSDTLPITSQAQGLPASLETTEASAFPHPPISSSNQNMLITQLGKLGPVWVPDSEANICTQCEVRFTFTKRRHHCRACGKIFCSACCNLKCKLEYLSNKEARVCSKCYQDIIRAQAYDRHQSPRHSPNPNNPSEYCSTIPPLQQAQANLNSPPPTVMVPIGVLRKQGTRRGEPKTVMFSDGIRPGGDLTELDGPGAEARIPKNKERSVKKVEQQASAPADSDNHSSPMKTKTVKVPDMGKSQCLIPENGLPPRVHQTAPKGESTMEENPDPAVAIAQIFDLDDPNPVIFAMNKNLLVMVKIVDLDCCVNRKCWCFTTKGMCTVGQDEVVIVLECLPDEGVIPRDIFCHLNSVYEEAGKGNTVTNMGHTIFAQQFLESKDHGGFLYIKPSFQCLQKLILPEPPYIFGILIQRWECPWAKVFPLRLMLRLGAEYRYYPCPLISVRFRKPVFEEIGHTIMNLLADFRNFQYMLSQVRGLVIHMEDKKTYIQLPRNRYDDVMKVLHNSNDHVVAFGANFSKEADSHLVCIQREDGNYQTQAINIQNKPRQITGASFVVFNGALKSNSGLRAKSSIVEDGLMVQISPDSMLALKQALRDMQDYSIGCGALEVTEPEETVVMQWVDDDKNVNQGLKSPIDNFPMDGVESVHILNATDYKGASRTIRWTQVFFIQNDDAGRTHCEPVDLSRLAETLARACCIALTPHLDKLKEADLTKLGLRATIDSERVGYEVGANGEKLPDFYMNHLDNELIPVIHNAASQNQEGPVVLELIFHVIE